MFQFPSCGALRLKLDSTVGDKSFPAIIKTLVKDREGEENHSSPFN